MKRVFLAALLMAAVAVQAQEVYKYWVGFTDKGQTTYSLDNPSAYLGPRALERRARQHIEVDSLDLPVSSRYIEALREMGLKVQHQTKWLNGVVVFAAERDMMADVYGLPFVRTVQLCEKGPLHMPDSMLWDWGEEYPAHVYDSLYGPDYYGGGYPQIKQLNGCLLHSGGYSGEGMVIGVCDAGFQGVDVREAFQAMNEEHRLLAVRDFVWEDGNVYAMHTHGTHVLSTMATYLPGIYVGTAPRASYVLCRTENPIAETRLEEYNWIAAAEYLDSLGADIITTSLGYYQFDDSLQNYTPDQLDGRTAPMSVAADIAVSRGMLVVNSVGNEGLASPQHLNVPADARRVLSVGAVDSDGNTAAFSSYGPTADQRVKPDVVAMGVHVAVATAMGGWSWNNGTSLSAPIMAGMMACLWQRLPHLGPDQLCDSVRSWGSMAHQVDLHQGYGIPDFGRAMESPLPLSAALADDAGTFKLYPNPAKEYVQCAIGIGAMAEGTLVLYDITGHEIWRKPVGSGVQTLTMAGLPRGMYWVRLSCAKGVYTRKLVLR